MCGNDGHTEFLHSADYFFTKEEFSIVKCNKCNFVYTNPVPAPEKLPSYYETEEYLSHQTEEKSLLGRVYQTIRGINIKRKYHLIETYKASGKVLEIGTGTGELLVRFKQNGWKTFGIEPNNKARYFANQQYGLDVHTEEQLDTFPSQSFDVIMLWHVLEHVFDLQKRMKQIKRLLKETGFVFIAVPNINSPDFAKYGKYWAGLDLPRHLYHFNEQSVRKLLQNHALKLIASYPLKFDAYYISLLSEKYAGKKIPYFPAFYNGFRSNLAAKKHNNYSSMIFVATEY